jgi:hypothetical protein
MSREFWRRGWDSLWVNYVKSLVQCILAACYSCQTISADYLEVSAVSIFSLIVDYLLKFGITGITIPSWPLSSAQPLCSWLIAFTERVGHDAYQYGLFLRPAFGDHKGNGNQRSIRYDALIGSVNQKAIAFQKPKK